MPPVQIRCWPEPLRPQAFHGILGETVRAIEPECEGDPAGLLLQLLAGFGSILGRTARSHVQGSTHFGNLFVCLVGATSAGRKGASWAITERLLSQVDSSWARDRVLNGLSSGEGLIHAVRFWMDGIFGSHIHYCNSWSKQWKHFCYCK